MDYISGPSGVTGGTLSSNQDQICFVKVLEYIGFCLCDGVLVAININMVPPIPGSFCLPPHPPRLGFWNRFIASDV